MALNDKDQWLKEFSEFSQISPGHVPETLLQSIRKRIFPNPQIVFAKVMGVHLVVGFLSLGVCHQFGLNPFGTEQSLADWFMKIGNHNFCMIACGILFMASTYLLANLFLSLEELEAIKRHQWLQTSVIGLFSLAVFYFFGAELVGAVAILWILGALLGGILSIEGSYRLRRSWA